MINNEDEVAQILVVSIVNVLQYISVFLIYFSIKNSNTPLFDRKGGKHAMIICMVGNFLWGMQYHFKFYSI